MRWWEDGPIHKAWNDFIFGITPSVAELEGHDLLVPKGFIDAPLWAGWAFFFGLVALSIVWYTIKKRSNSNKKNL